ncbi:MAG: hypothetical protein GY948_03840 [Alphaproteobacteria bacterium]|nr:hypothetical protein [Alphaproteobacteria bacterium]
MYASYHSARRLLGRSAAFALGGVVLVSAACTTANAGLVAKSFSPPAYSPSASLIDGFESPKVNRSMWWLGQAQKGQFWSDARLARSDRRSVAVRVGAAMRGCGAKCQRNELRTAPGYRIRFGQEAWYNFSFRIDGKLPARHTGRWVSGQWKQQCGGSPFLAQRFDRGVFQITVQDNSCRVIVASSQGLGRKLPATRLTGHEARQLAKNSKSCASDIKVQYSSNATLPNPYEKWVDMAYRVRGGRNGTGLIEIWANGRFIARVTGSIGYDYASGPHQYFKFGIYRAPMPGTSVARMDRFMRTGSMSMFRMIDGG